MPQVSAARIAELHHIAAHAHMAAAAAQKKGGAAAVELARRAQEYSAKAFEASRMASIEVASGKPELLPAKTELVRPRLERWAS